MFALSVALLSSLRLVAAHASIWHPSMFGFNVTAQTFPYDNRPVVPLMNRPFSEWWFHGHLNYPPHPEDVFELPAGQDATMQIACDKGATTYYASSPGGNIQEPNNPNNPCPGAPTSEFHTTGLSDVKGCALAIAYKSDVSQVQPSDFTVFSVNQTCVWNRYTDFGVPDRMPPCPNNMCICAFFWIHSPDSGSEQNYMNGFQCRVTNSISTVGLATPPKLARRCGADPAEGKPSAVPGNCTYGPKQPFYWFQAEQNNVFEGTYSPPFYNDLYNFIDGPQKDIFQNFYTSIPTPGPNQTELPVLAQLPVLSGNGNNPETTPTSSAPPLSSSVASSPVHPDSGNNSETTPASSVPPVSPSVTPSSPAPSSQTTSSSRCMKKRRADPSSMGHASAERPISPFSHRAAGFTRRSRPLNTVKKSDIWKPV